MIRKALRLLDRGNCNTSSLALELEVSRGTLNAVLGTALREGYIEKMMVCSDCSNCLLCSNRKEEISEVDKVGTYLLASKGRRYLKTSE